MSVSVSRSIATLRTPARGFASSARIQAETAPSAQAPRQPRSNNQFRRPPRTGGSASERLRAGVKSRDAAQEGNRAGGGDRRNKRLPSVFDASRATLQQRPDRSGGSVKSIGQDGGKKMPAPTPSTDWNSPLLSKPGFERMLAAAPRTSQVFTPSLAAAAPSAPSSGGKGKGKAAPAATQAANDKLNLPGIKTAVNALKLHVRPGGRNILGPLNNPTGVAAGTLTLNRAKMPRSTALKGTDDQSLASELKQARIALQNEQIGGSYQRYEPEAVLKAAGVQAKGKETSVQTRAVQDAAQALAVNADLAPESKIFVARTIAERLNA